MEYVLIMEPAYHSPVGSASSGLWSLQQGLEKNILCPKTRGLGGIVLEGLFSSLHVICV